jgi:hypothetical protein
LTHSASGLITSRCNHGIEQDSGSGANYISFYDPDGIAWELYAMPPR